MGEHGTMMEYDRITPQNTKKQENGGIELIYHYYSYGEVITK